MSTDDIELWCVEIFNDADTPMSFVVKALMTAFNLDIFAATHEMMILHQHVSVRFGPFTKDIAHTKAGALLRMAEGHGMTLVSTATAWENP